MIADTQSGHPLRTAARGQHCVRCGAEDGSVVLAHYSGFWQHRFGKGIGKKGHDIAGADLCARCHRYFDEYQGVRDELSRVVRSEEFLACCLLTVIRRLQQNVLAVVAQK